MGGGVSGGTSTQLAGTFLAEQTHFQPPKYTLVSVSSALGPDGCPRHVPSSSSAAERNGRIRPSGGPAPVMTVIPALADIEPLLKGFQLAEDNEQQEKERTDEFVKSAGRVEQGSKEKEANEDSPPRPRRGGARGAAERDAAAASEAVNRLCAGRHTPWVAKRTDAELYSYLAQRSRDPNMAKLAASAELASPKAADSTDSSPRSKARQKHSSHNELFDSCLRQDQTRPRSVSQMRSVFWSSLPPSCSPKSPRSPIRTRPASQERPKARERALTDRLYGDYLRRKERAKARELLAGVPWDKDKTESEMLFTQSTMTPRPSDMFSSRFSELIEDLSVKDIPVLPEDPVETFLQRKPKRDDAGSKSLVKKTSSYYFDKDRPVKKSTVQKGSSKKGLNFLS